MDFDSWIHSSPRHHDYLSTSGWNYDFLSYHLVYVLQKYLLALEKRHPGGRSQWRGFRLFSIYCTSTWLFCTYRSSWIPGYNRCSSLDFQPSGCWKAQPTILSDSSPVLYNVAHDFRSADQPRYKNQIFAIQVKTRDPVSRSSPTDLRHRPIEPVEQLILREGQCKCSFGVIVV